MNPTSHGRAHGLRFLLPLMMAAPLAASALPVITFSNFPLFLAPATKPNVMIILDNSQSMDATMAGKIIDGNIAETRGNIARGVLRSVLGDYRNDFNWGLTAFATNGVTLMSTYPYFMGNDTTMIYTNNCVNGVSPPGPPTNGLRCIPNPEAAVNGFSHITYAKSGDDSDINDVLYTNNQGPQIYGVGIVGSFDSFNTYRKRDGTVKWTDANFSSPWFSGSFGATDAGFTPVVNNFPRQLFTFRGWGYLDGITGKGNIVEVVKPDTAVHFNRLIELLGNETNGATAEIKNNAVATPLAGSLLTVREYFNNSTAGKPTPISETCQRNFIMLATDGNPTGTTSGGRYSIPQWTNIDNPIGSNTNWTYGQAQKDLFAELTSLRSTPYNAKNYDVQTYVVGMGDSVANPSSLASLNKMAELGGGNPTAFVGSDTAALTTAFRSIVADIQAKTSAAASVALNSGSTNPGSALYQAKFDSRDWSGNLLAFPILDSGDLSAVSTWDAAATIKAQNWDTGRNVLTYKPSAAIGQRGIPFRWPANRAVPTATEMDTGQSAALNLNAAAANDGFGLERHRYLRGDASRETRNCGACALQFRNRGKTPLGDIVNSSPYHVGAPNYGYYDDFESVAYSSFVATNLARTKVIYVGANDGMLHAINAATGAEMFAYVPSAVYPALSQLTDLNYNHLYSVDGSPTVGDVFYGGAWHSLLVAGMRTGAKGLYALDVTTPGNFAEANAASIVRWEFTDPDMGYVFGQPLLVKTNNGRWSVVVSGGYNTGNANGHAFLFVIDAETGALIRKIDTGAGTAASPNGLSPAAAIDVNGDAVADSIYAGDLNGNLWKFDLSAAAPASWVVGNAALPLFVATSQSITGRPDVTKFPAGGYLVVFGTGRYIATADNTDVSGQTEYAVRDNNLGATVTLAQLQQQTIQQVVNGANGRTYRVSTHAVDPAKDGAVVGDNVITRANYLGTKMGWYMNLPSSGERSPGNARFRSGRVIFTTIIPNVSNPCEYGGKSWVMELDAITGNRYDSPTFDTSGNNIIGPEDVVNGSVPSGEGLDGIASDAAVSRVRGGGNGGTSNAEDKYSNTSEGRINRIRETAGKDSQGRVMWREVR